MNPCILFIADNPVLATCYGEALARSGFHVSVAFDAESALARLPEVNPSAIVTDLLLPRMSVAEFISRVRGDINSHQIPVIGLPTELEPLAMSAQTAGLTKRVERHENPIAGLIQAIESTLSLQVSAGKPAQQLTRENSTRCTEDVVQRLGGLQRGLLTAVQPSGNPARFHDLLLQVHHFAELSALLGWKPIFQLATSLEALVFDLESIPEQATASTVRTVSQGVDFMTTLMAEARWTKVKPTNESQVLVVEDDTNARQLIVAAMHLVNLAANPTESPSACLAETDQKSFHLIFLDVGLPEMNGFELCAKIRSNPRHANTPVVFLTGMATFQNRVQSTLSGARDFIGKPFNLAELGVKALMWVFKGQLGITK